MDLQMLYAFGVAVAIGVVIIVCGLLGWDWLTWLWGRATRR
ncbi:hypothetical protein AB0F17_66160 [Nonomuraea sp. NPDC026600]